MRNIVWQMAYATKTPNARDAKIAHNNITVSIADELPRLKLIVC